MKNTDDTTETSGAVRTTSRAGRIVWAVVWAAPGDHAVGEPELDHHRAEVGHVDDDVAGPLEVDALVLAAFVVLRREPLAQLRVGRAEQPGGREVDAEQAGALLDLAGLAEDRQVGDPAAQQDVGGPEDPVVVALGQHDVPAVGDGQVDQLVLEHQRRHRVGAGDLEPVEQQRRRRRAPRTAPARWPPCGASPCRAGRAPTSAPASCRWCRASVATIGIVVPSPSISRRHLVGQRRSRR